MTAKELAEYLHYGSDEFNEQSLDAAIKAGEAALKNLTDKEDLDFTSEGLAKELLKHWCRYYLNNASEYFEKNFAPEILRLQLQVGVEVMDSATETGT